MDIMGHAQTRTCDPVSFEEIVSKEGKYIKGEVQNGENHC